MRVTQVNYREYDCFVSLYLDYDVDYSDDVVITSDGESYIRPSIANSYAKQLGFDKCLNNIVEGRQAFLTLIINYQNHGFDKASFIKMVDLIKQRRN